MTRSQRHLVEIVGYSSDGKSQAQGGHSVGGPSGPDVTAPTITSLDTAILVENIAFSLTLTANETVTWTKTGGADAAQFTLTGNVLSMTAKDYEIPLDVGGDNTYVVQVTATDVALNETVQTITVTITNADEIAPTITSSAGILLVEGDALAHTLTANETVTWTKTGGADAALFTLSGNILSLTAKDFEVPLDVGGNNTYVVQVVATDASLNATAQTITVTVTDLLEPLSDIMPLEMIATSFYQEDLPIGAVSSWQSRGVKQKTAVQADVAKQPEKLIDNRGVLFSQGTMESLFWQTDNDVPYLHRWWIAIARCPTAAIVGNVNVFTINGTANNSVERQPRITFVPSAMQVSAFDTAAKTIAVAAATDVEVWNVLVGYRRGYELHSIVNAVEGTLQPFQSWTPNQAGGSLSFMGDGVTNLVQNIAIDCVVIGQSEPTDAQIDKLVGWGMWRAGRSADLPPGHPYKLAPPVGMDNPPRYAYDAAAWNTWVNDTNTIRFTNRGGAPPAITGYSTVFFDDFVDPTVVNDRTGAPGNVWFAPTHLTTIGSSATAQQVAASPSSYIHDAGATTMALRMLFNGSWKTGAFASIDNNGQGRLWKKGIFEIRCKFPALAAPRPGFFPAFWAYGIDHLFWRTRNRLETDFWEYDGLNGAWINITQHVHGPKIPFVDPEVLAVDVSKKIAGYAVGPANGFPATIDIYDGLFHTWYVQIEDDFTYIVLDGLEVARCPTSPELAAEKYILVDWAYDPSMGGATIDTGQTYDMTIDYIKVRQKETDLAIVPAGFSARPTLAGSVIDGQTLTLTPNTTGQLRYRWYRDGVPIVTALTNTYVLSTIDIGHKIRAYVKNFALVGKPFAWTAQTATVIAIPIQPAAVIDGTGTIGSRLWAEGIGPFQWKRDGVDISGATTQSYLIVSADDLTALTCVDSSGLPSNAIGGTWVRIRQNGTPALLDMDRQNDRYWFAGQRYTRAEFQALPWVPDDITSLISATAWTDAGAPFPGFDPVVGAIIATATMNDTNVDNNLVTFSDNTANEVIAFQVQWSQASPRGRILVVDNGVNQVSLVSPVGTDWVPAVQATSSFKYRANDCWMIGKTGYFSRDTVCTMPTVTQMRIGSNHIGGNIASGTVDRVTYFAGDIPPSDIEMILDYDILTLFYGLTENDANEGRDIFGDGFQAILNTQVLGPVTLYRQQKRGVFTPIIVSTLTDLGEVESNAMVDIAGTGVISLFTGDQNRGNIYQFDRVGDYSTWGARTLIQANRKFVQDMVPIVFPGDDRESIVYTWEGTSNGNGGVNKLRWNGTAWVDSVIVQRDGAYGIALERFANGDLLISARNASNTQADPGVFRLSLAGVVTNITTQAATDWKQPSIGDFFGNGNEDVSCNIGGTGISGVFQQHFSLFDSANAWAQTTVNVGRDLYFGCRNAGFKVNGRDAVIVSNGQSGATTPWCEIWAWNGSAWALYKALNKVSGTFKLDDRPAKMNIFRQLPGNDFVWGDSFGFKIVAIRSVP